MNGKGMELVEKGNPGAVPCAIRLERLVVIIQMD
jgi:hypothetical protein